MRNGLVVLAAVLAVLVFSVAPSQAAVQGSRHDMGSMSTANAAYNGLVGTYGLCSACHVPHKAGGAKLWPKTPPAVSATFGTLGFTCAYCHDGGNAANNPSDMSQTVFTAGSMSGHKMGGLAASTLYNPDGSTTLASTVASTLPYTGTLTNANYMECVSCHSVHNSYSNRPFIEAKSGVVTGLDDLCVACHSGRTSVLMGAANASGIHPSGATITGDITTPGNSPIVALSTIMDAFPAGMTGAASETQWNAGAHLTQGTNNGVYCNSCHSVHGNDGAGTGTARLATAPYGTYLLAFNPGSGAANAFCESCHQGGHGVLAAGGATTTWPNPGAAAAKFHPADDDATNGAGRVVTITTPAGWTFGPTAGAGAEVQCTTCHGVHNTTNEGKTFANSPALRKSGVNDTGSATNFCMACHDATNSRFDCFHTGHVQATAGGGGTWGTGSGEMNNGNRVAWAGTFIGAAGSGSQMDCYVCHKAHNVSYDHLLRAEFSSASAAGAPDKVCTDCHSANPSTYTTSVTGATNMASHFVGLVTTAKDTTNGFPAGGFGTADLNFSAQKTNAWPNTAISVYANPVTGSSNKGAVTCLSCHVTGNTCGTSSSTASITATGDGASTYMMIAPSGNNIETFGSAVNRGDTVTTEPNYLCTGCHGQNAFAKKATTDVAGTTHPLLGVTATTTAPIANFNGTLTPAKHVNCESCHRAHDAATKSGSYILENNSGDTAIGSTNTLAVYVEPTHSHNVFCSSCHSTK